MVQTGESIQLTSWIILLIQLLKINMIFTNCAVGKMTSGHYANRDCDVKTIGSDGLDEENVSACLNLILAASYGGFALPRRANLPT